ncbi:MAG: response regulator [Armatimonadetes bacterium]|nr:response regulator [Armatimonadota bacterium]
MSETSGLKVSVLAIEDDPAIRNLLQAAFENTEFRLTEATTASEGIEAVTKKRPDLILLDLSLPDTNGIKVIETVRGWTNVPILIVSGFGQEEAKVAALEAGADDYVTKPFGVSELIARMKVALRHAVAASAPDQDAVFESGDLKIDRSNREVFVRGERVKLTPIEYKLLCSLAKHAGKVVTHRQLLAEVWGEEYSEEAQYLRVYVGYLRKKLESEPENPRLLLSEPRVGYRLAV